MYKKKPLEQRKTKLELPDPTKITKKSDGKITRRTEWFCRELANRANFAVSDVKLILVAFREIIEEIIDKDEILCIPGLFRIYHIEHKKVVRDVYRQTDEHLESVHTIKIIPAKSFLRKFTDRYSTDYWKRDNQKRYQYLKAYQLKKKEERHRLKEERKNNDK